MTTLRLRGLLAAIAIAAGPLCLVGQSAPASDQAPPQSWEWSENRLLTLEDFHAAPDAASNGAALTVYEIQARTNCEVDGPAFRVSVRFLPGQSWIKPPQRVARILAHEQGHFDLAEVSARRLRAELASLDLPCAAGNDAFKELVAETNRRDGDLQRSYDRQTMFGTDTTAQRQWESRIKSWIRAETQSGFHQ